MLEKLAVLARLRLQIAKHPLTHDRQLAAWGRFLKWQLMASRQTEHVVPWIGGESLVVRSGMTAATGNIYLGLMEPIGMLLTMHFLREEDLFLDVGANVGTYTVCASGVARCTTWSFEPDPRTFEDLERNVAVNRLGDRVVVHPVALGPEDGTVGYTTGLGPMNRVAGADERATQRVQQRRLDPLLGERVPSMIKLDVEGYEEDVLRGAVQLLGKPGLKVILTESCSPWMSQAFADNGFEKAFYDPFARRLAQAPTGYRENLLFVRDRPFVETRLATARPIAVLGRTI